MLVESIVVTEPHAEAVIAAGVPPVGGLTWENFTGNVICGADVVSPHQPKLPQFTQSTNAT